MKRTLRRACCLLLILTMAASCAAGCGYRPKGAAAEPAKTGETAVQETSPAAPAAEKTWTVLYMADGEEFARETVAEGRSPAAVPAVYNGCGILSWTDGDGTEADARALPVYADAAYTAKLGPALHSEGGLIAAETDGLFHPMDSFTRSDAARAVYALMAKKPTGETFLKDVTTKARCYKAATALVTAGYMALDESGKFYPDVPITHEDLAALLSHLFAGSTVQAVLAALPDPMTRADAAGLFAALLAPQGSDRKAYFPDVAPGSADYAAISFAGAEGEKAWGSSGRAEPGFVNLEGYLYLVDSDGYFVTARHEGDLYFDASGRYTSGDTALDKFVADVIDSHTKPRMSREEMLREMYLYVRDSFLYLKRNMYEIGETGWEVSEALTMFQTGKGNCYNFSGVFWALCRGIGYDAVCVSGLVGVGRDPHSWVEIEMDGTMYIFDPETEMSQRLQDDYISNLYKMTYKQGEYWSYARVPYEDG